VNGTPHNPYAAPQAEVADRAANRLPLPVPIVKALIAAALAFAIWAVIFTFESFALQGTRSWVFLAETIAPLAILQAWVLTEIRRGSTWARFAQAVLVVCAGIGMVPILVDLGQSEPLLASIELVDLFLGAGAVYLLFVPGRDWFQRRNYMDLHGTAAPPRNVTIALGLIAAATIVQTAFKVWEFLRDGDFGGDPRAWVRTLAWCGIVAMLCIHMSRRQNWARLVYVAITLVVFLEQCYYFGAARRELGEDAHLLWSVRFLVPLALPLALALVAVHLLCFSSGAWFRAVDRR
jgi:hypothetical protein